MACMLRIFCVVGLDFFRIVGLSWMVWGVRNVGAYATKDRRYLENHDRIISQDPRGGCVCGGSTLFFSVIFFGVQCPESFN